MAKSEEEKVLQVRDFLLINKTIHRQVKQTAYFLDTIKSTSCTVFAFIPDLTFNSEYPSTIKWIINLWHL